MVVTTKHHHRHHRYTTTVTTATSSMQRQRTSAAFERTFASNWRYLRHNYIITTPSEQHIIESRQRKTARTGGTFVTVTSPSLNCAPNRRHRARNDARDKSFGWRHGSHRAKEEGTRQTHAHTHTHTHTHTRTHAHTHARARARAHTHNNGEGGRARRAASRRTAR